MGTKIKIKKGDTVRVITGSHKGSEGTVMSISREINKAIVEGVNMILGDEEKVEPPTYKNTSTGTTRY